MTFLPNSILNDDSHSIDTLAELKDAFWHNEPTLFEHTVGKQRTQVAMQLDWDSYSFPDRDGERYTQHGVILETLNRTELSVLIPTGFVLQLGDIISFDHSNSSYMSGSSTTKTYTDRITGISNTVIHSSRTPTYSNTSNSSRSVRFNNINKIVERNNLELHRHRLTERPSAVSIPEEVNGWTLSSVSEFDIRQNTSIGKYYPQNVIDEIIWTNNDGARFQAKWRTGYNCWRLATPETGCVSQLNVDDYIYEVDVPQHIVRTQDIIALAVDGMENLDPKAFQEPYSLDPDDTESPQPNIDFPRQIGGWQRTETYNNRLTWKNINEESNWHRFTLELSHTGSITVKCRNVHHIDCSIHDSRRTTDPTPCQEHHPELIDANKEYGSQYRAAFDENWIYAIAFMAQTSTETHTLESLGLPQSVDCSLSNINTGLDQNPYSNSTKEHQPLSAF